jgi:hypothetical protein
MLTVSQPRRTSRTLTLHNMRHASIPSPSSSSASGAEPITHSAYETGEYLRMRQAVQPAADGPVISEAVTLHIQFGGYIHYCNTPRGRLTFPRTLTLRHWLCSLLSSVHC